MAFTLIYTPRARDHLKKLRKGDQQTIVDTTEEQLAHQPGVPTKKRKRLQENPLAPWELRIGDFRVFYDIHEEEEQVLVVAVDRKERDKLFIGGEEIHL
jgi:mRNA-degrading endonuclease RelE of RelBE toxin-antitoxin system